MNPIPQRETPMPSHASQHAFVVVAYGDSPFLPECLASIAAQTQAGSDVVVTTSTPSQYLADTARHHDVPLIINPTRASIGTDWNFALLATRAGHVTLAHQDDTYRPDYLATMESATARVPEVLMGFCDYRESTSAGPRAIHLNLRLKQFLCHRAFGRGNTIHSVADKRRLLEWGNPICCPSVLLNRAAVPDFRFTEALKSNLDWDAWSRLAEQPGAFVYVREPLVIRRIHPQSETSALIADERRFDEDRAMFGRFWPAPVAALIATIYRASYRANRT